jgi:multiple sugar transport system permease protein/raffinose/stachyose/melibiose transport system permease protein
MTNLEPLALTPAPENSPGAGVVTSPGRRRRGHYSLLNRHDKILLGLMVGVPLAVFIVLIWCTTIASIGLSFTNWDLYSPIKFVGIDNYRQLFTTYPFFWPAVFHNLVWLIFFVCVATPMGVLLAVCLDRPMRGSRIYQSIFFTPVVLSLAVVGFIWELQYSPLAGNGFIDSALVSLNLIKPAAAPDWLGDPTLNIWAVLVAASWRHIGYIMVLYLAGLKSVDPALREAAAIDGANERQTFFHVVFPVMAPINVVIVVVTVIESLRAFDIAYIINHGKNGLELLSTLIVNNALSEASLIGFGSAIAVILLTVSLVPIVIYLTRVMRSEES